MHRSTSPLGAVLHTSTSWPRSPIETLASLRLPRVAGFVIGFRVPEDPQTCFVWQVGVASRARRTGLAAAMVDHLIERTGARFLEATVTPDNAASTALFRSVGTRHDAPVDVGPAFAAELFPDGHEPELRFRIGPLRPRQPNDNTPME